MSSEQIFETAVSLMDAGKVEELRDLLRQNPELAKATDEGNATLLIRLIDWPGFRPRSAETARVLLEAGTEVDARRNSENGTAIAGALCSNEFDVAEILLAHGANVDAPLGWMKGTVISLADRICQDLGRQRDEKIIGLKTAFKKIAGRDLPSQAPFGGTTPLLFVKDVHAGIQFYKDVLGFHVDWTYDDSEGDPYVGISRGKAEFHLTRCQCDDQRHTGNLWIRIECDQIDSLYDQIKNSGVKILQEPKDQPWGFRELDIEDPDGNRLAFFGPTSSNG